MKDFETPVFCVRCWKLADYLQLETLKHVSAQNLEDHLDAMALLASNDMDFEDMKPTWLKYFFDGFQAACADEVTKPLQTTFITFLWVTRFEMLQLSQTLEILRQFPDVQKDLLNLLIWNEFEKSPDWLPDSNHIERDIQNKKDITFPEEVQCSKCINKPKVGEGPRFYNPFPVGRSRIGQLMWCKKCAAKINQYRNWPWRNEGWGKLEKIKVKAWSWDDEE